MFASLIKNIKANRKYPLSHWRYRLIHWCFGVKNPDAKNLKATGLPMHLYTHLCPMFHLSNFILLFIWAIAPIKAIIWMAAKSVKGVARCFSILDSFMDLVWSFLPDVNWELVKNKAGNCVPTIPPPPESLLRWSETRQFAQLVKYHLDWHFTRTWELWLNLGYANFLTIEAAEKIHNEIVAKAVKDMELTKKRQKQYNQRITHLVNLSHELVKWLLNGVYLTAGVGLVYGMYWFAPTGWEWLCTAFDSVCYAGSRCWSFVCWLFTDSISADSLLSTGKYMLLVSIGGIGLYHLLKHPFTGKAFSAFGKSVFFIGKRLAVFAPVLYVFPAIGGFIKQFFIGTIEFLVMFYQNNCPAVTIVSEEEASRGA